MGQKKFETRTVVAVALSHLVHDVFGSFLAPLMPLLIAKLGFSLLLAGLLDIVRKIPALFNPMVGRLADRSDMRWFLIAAPLATAVSMSLMGLAPNYYVLLFLVVIAGLGSSFFHVPAPVIVSRHSGDRIGRGMSFFMVGGELAR
ncbi:MFS transporter, partial [Myxococcota bacterium]|nr:MFS transporter [Myxococcota bacterium]